MGLDYSSGCVNFRDVGDSLSLVADADLFPTGKIFRGGKIDFVGDLMAIQSPATILNLRHGNDPENFPTTYAHFPTSNDLEKYETNHREVRKWVNEVVAFIADSTTELPVLLPCTSGKDRTGVIVAALLLIVGIDRNLIVEEYFLSDGKVKREWIEMALDGMENVDSYLNRVDLESLRSRLACSLSADSQSCGRQTVPLPQREILRGTTIQTAGRITDLCSHADTDSGDDNAERSQRRN